MRRILIISFVILVLLGIWFRPRMGDLTLRIKQSFGESTAVAQEKGDSWLVTAETRLKEVSTLLDAGDYYGAYALYDDLFNALKKLRYQPTDAGERIPAEKLEAEIARLEGRIADQVAALFEQEMELLRAGAPDTLNISRLLDTFDHVGNRKVSSVYYEAGRELDLARRVHAPRWIRVRAVGAVAQFGDEAMKALGARIQVPPGYRLVYGSPVGRKEESATYCTFYVDVSPVVERYIPSKFANLPVKPAASELIVGLDLRINMHGRSSDTRLPYKWDSESRGELRFSLRSSRDVKIVAPENLSPPDDVPLADFFREQNLNHTIELRRALSRRLANLPAVEFARVYGNYGRPNVFERRAEFIDALRAEAATGKPKEEVWRLVAEVGIEELASDLTGYLATNTASKDVVRKLAAQPWLGDYQPMLQVVRNGFPNAFDEALSGLAPELEHPGVWDEIRERLTRESWAPRSLASWANQIHSDDLPALLTRIPELPENLRTPFLEKLRARYPREIDTVMKKNANDSAPDAQSLL